MKIYVTRHGQTNWNLERKGQGKADIELNETGKQQARKTKEALSKEKIDLIISSPLKRAIQTAKIINEDKNIPIIIDDRIAERDLGEFQGKLTDEIDGREFWDYKKNHRYEKAENIAEFYNRVYTFLDSLKEEYKEKNVLLVTHGGVSIPIHCYFNGIPEIDDLTSLALGNCEVTEYDCK
jgi:broad specificity phosphatase PhoE